MEGHREGCIVCGAPLVYSDLRVERRCSLCGKAFLSEVACEKGHFVCDTCHSEGSLSTVKGKCLSMKGRDPVEIFLLLVSSPDVHMHGPEHHVIVGSSLLTAVHNSGRDLDLGKALDEMEYRGKQAPGGICGYWGTCGAAVSCGMAYSIMSSCSPLSGEEWGKSNLMVSRCLEAIGSIGGPRCCKRDGITALKAASGFLKEYDSIELEIPSTTVCTFRSRNPQCIGKRCPYMSGRVFP